MAILKKRSLLTRRRKSSPSTTSDDLKHQYRSSSESGCQPSLLLPNLLLLGSCEQEQEEEEFTDSEIALSGYLVKQGSYWKTWKKRFFILRCDHPVLCYYSFSSSSSGSSHSLIKLGEMDLPSSTSVQLVIPASRRTPESHWQFSIQHSNRKLVVDAENEPTWVMWKEALDRCIHSYASSSCSSTSANAELAPITSPLPHPTRPCTTQPPPVHFLSLFKKSTSSSSIYGPTRRRNSSAALVVGDLSPLKWTDSELQTTNATGTATTEHGELQLALSVGRLGPQPSLSLFLVVFEITKTFQNDPRLTEIDRTEIQPMKRGRWIDGKISQKDFSVLIRVPTGSHHVSRNPFLQIEVFAIKTQNQVSEQLSAHQSIGYVRCCVQDILAQQPRPLHVSCRSSSSASHGGMFIEIQGYSTSTNGGRGADFEHQISMAQKSFLVDAVLDVNHHDHPSQRKQDGGGSSKIMITEELFLSPCMLQITSMYLSYLMDRDRSLLEKDRQTYASNAEQHTFQSTDVIANNGLIQDMLEQKMQRLAQKISFHEKLLKDYHLRQVYYDSLYRYATSNNHGCVYPEKHHKSRCRVDSCWLKKSTEKKEQILNFLPINCCTHSIQVTPAPTLVSSPKSKSQVVVVTHGAPADHVGGYREGGLRRLLAELQLQQQPSSSFSSSESAKNHTPTISSSNSPHDLRLEQHLYQRMDVVTSQALSIACQTLLSSIGAAANQSVYHQHQLELASHTGKYLMQVESLLSTMGNEGAMLEDLDVGIKWLNHLEFEFEPLEAHQNPHRVSSSPTLSRCTSIKLVHGKLRIVLALGPRYFHALPRLWQSESHVLSLTAVVFTQGINEMQSVANSVFNTTLQDEINLESFRTLELYVEAYQQALTTVPRPKTNVGYLPCPDLSSLHTILHSPKTSLKQINILVESHEVCTQVYAGRTICCKSGKDRTAMAITLELSKRLVEELRVKQGKHLCDAMRLRGVRRQNVEWNTGKNKYAFNAFQVKYLPDCYRPPTGSHDAATPS